MTTFERELCTVRSGTRVIRMANERDWLIEFSRLMLIDEPGLGVLWIFDDGSKHPPESS